MKMMQHKFVNLIPEHIEDNVIYVSLEYCTAVHKCVCGCGCEVVTPLSPTDWELAFNGKAVSLYPSIGNWNFKCRSHYWIRKGKIIWSGQWTAEEIAVGRENDRSQKRDYFNEVPYEPTDVLPKALKEIKPKSWWRVLFGF